MSQPWRFDRRGPVPPPDQLGRVHLVAIGGAGMSAVARLLLQAGVRVSGSDAADSATLRGLAEAGAEVHVGHDAAYVQQLAPTDTVVVSSAIREDNPELATARARRLRVLHRSQALASLMSGRRRVAVAGASGKTTTTAMLTIALRACGADPSYAIGGEPEQLGSNAALGTGEVFVVEADESDGSFLGYAPQVAVVTNVQPDHLDFYGSFGAVQQAYDRFAATVVEGGMLVACADDPGSAALAEAARGRGQRVVSYGTHPAAGVRLAAVRTEGLASGARVLEQGEPGRELVLGLPGRHNLLDAAAAYAAATAGLGQDAEAVLRGLASYRGTRRRFEPLGEAAGVRVVDDYAHNPEKVAAVVETARGVAGAGRLVVAFQPHLYSRTRHFAGPFAAALSGADVVVVTDVYGAREDPEPGVSGRLVADELASRPRRGGHLVEYVADVGRLPDALAALARPGDLVVTVGAGDITTVGPELLALLRQRQRDGTSLGPSAGPGDHDEGGWR